jgi:DNA polymerase-3 subunit alpha
MISVILRSTHDQEKDVRRMKSIQGLMQSSPGKDHFSFHIIEDGRRCLIEFPNHTTGITPSLLSRLEKLVGISNYRIDPIIVH